MTRLSKLQVDVIKQHYKEKYGAESCDELWDDLAGLDLPGPAIQIDGTSAEECEVDELQEQVSELEDSRDYYAGKVDVLEGEIRGLSHDKSHLQDQLDNYN